MADMDITWLGAILSRHSRENSIASVLSLAAEPACNVCDNYASIVYRATVKVVLGSGKVTSRKLIIKKAIPDVPHELALELCRAFNVEVIMYDNILSKYESVIFDKCLNYSKFWPDCIKASHNLFILEDLKMSGFTLVPRKTGLDTVHAKLVITNLARLHSLSVVTVFSGEVLPIMLPGHILLETGAGKALFQTSFKALADVMCDSWGADWSEAEMKIRRLIDDIVPTMIGLYKQQHKLSVINHGDSWITNMMFKYDSQGIPTQQKFIDFQMSCYNSYGWDLTYFLHSSINPKYLHSHYDEFIECYSNEFSRNLTMLGHDTSIAPTVSQVKEELTRLRPLALAVSCSIFPIATNPTDIEIGLEGLLKDSSKFRMLFENKQFELTFQSILNRFIDEGVL